MRVLRRIMAIIMLLVCLYSIWFDNVSRDTNKRKISDAKQKSLTRSVRETISDAKRASQGLQTKENATRAVEIHPRLDQSKRTWPH